MSTDSVLIYRELYKRLFSIPGGVKQIVNGNVDILIEFKNDTILINKYGIKHCISLNYTFSEIYPIIFSVIYDYFFDIGSIGVHSVLVSNDNNTYLIVGDFGQGKTTLALELEKIGFKILSCDQTEVKYQNGKILAQSGSRLNKISEKFSIIDEFIDAPRTINGIYKVRGLSYQGYPSFNEITDPTRKTFNIWPTLTWPWQNPLISGTTSNLGWDLIKAKCFAACKILSNLPQVELRGDAKILASMISDAYFKKNQGE